MERNGNDRQPGIAGCHKRNGVAERGRVLF